MKNQSVDWNRLEMRFQLNICEWNAGFEGAARVECSGLFSRVEDNTNF